MAYARGSLCAFDAVFHLHHGTIRELVDQCPCREESGCPGCVHHGDCPQYNAVLDKSAALVVLDAVLEAEEAWMGEEEQCK